MATAAVPVLPKYSPGDVIQECVPIIKSLSLQFRTNRCNNCFGLIHTPLSCANCSQVNYCHQSCLVEDSKNGHKVECDIWKADESFMHYCHNDGQEDFKLYLLRVYAMLKTKPETATKRVPTMDGGSQCFNNLLEKASSVSASSLLDCKEFVRRLCGADPDCKLEAEDVIRWLRIRGYVVLDENKRKWLGFGIYVEFSTIKHSCKPNAVYVNFGLKLQVRAICQIAQGEEPRICMLKKHLNKADRWKKLAENGQIGCDCEKCLTESDNGVDYDKLNSLVKEIKSYQSQSYSSDTNARPKSSDVYQKFHETVQIMRTLYHEYDERITKLYMKTIQVGMMLKFNTWLFKSLYQDCKDHVLKTYGETHGRGSLFIKKADKHFYPSP